MKTLEEFAEENDCYIKHSGDAIAVCQRDRDDEGRERVRYAPDPADYHHLLVWEISIHDEKGKTLIC